MELTDQGMVGYALKSAYHDGTPHFVFEPLDFMAKLAPNFILEDYLFGTAEELPHFALLFEGARIAGIPITPEDLK